MSRSLPEILFDTRRALHLNNHTLADFLGVSVRTVQRNTKDGGVGYAHHHHQLIRGVYPKDRALAAEYAQALGTNLVDLGLELPATPAPPPPARPEHADAVVYAAADALGLAPRAVRPAVLAVFARATELGLDLSALSKLFAAERAKPKPA